MDCAGIDFGGSVTDVVLRRDDGRDVLRAEAAVSPPTADDVRRLLHDVRPGNGSPLAFVAVTGGRSFELPEVVDDVPIVVVDESAATAAGAVRDGVAVPSIVVSLGTGTGIVLARPPEEPLRLIGSGIGGGTLVGLGRLLLGTADPAEIGRLAERGDPGACDLSVEDIVGRGIGPVRGDATASHFGRLVRPDGSSRPEDVAAALVRLVGQTALRLSIDSVLLHQARSIVLVGHVLDVPGFRESILRTPGVDPSFVLLAAEPGFVAARGAIAIALRTRPDLAA